MRIGYVLPDPSVYPNWAAFEADLACIRAARYDAVELQIIAPDEWDEERTRMSLASIGLSLCAVQTGQTYALRGNCLSTANEAVRRRTIELLKRFVGVAARWGCPMVVGTLQGRLSDEPDRDMGARRIVEALDEVARVATEAGAVVAFEPVQHGEVGFHNTIAEVEAVVRCVAQPGLRLMVDTFHMNIEERDMLGPLEGISDVLVHVHLCETNRGALGEGHWPTVPFLRELNRTGYTGAVSVGVYNSRAPRQDCIARCMDALRAASGKAGGP
jgi:sugar phosphate isomerase/epimerase